METNISGNQGDVIGVGIGGKGNITGKNVTVHGNVIHLSISADAVAALRRVAAVPTEVQPNAAAGIQGSQVPETLQAAKGTISQLLQLFNARSPGGEMESVQAGGVNLSRVDLLVKQAVLQRTEAGQMYFDQINRRKHLVEEAKARSGGGSFDLDFNRLLEGFDEKGHEAKLREAYRLLEQANRLDGTNTEVLLHMAELLIELTPDDPSDEQRLLYRVQGLLREPKDDNERFRLAQATFLLAVSSKPLHPDLLQEARGMFVKLGRSLWVKQCDDLLASAGQGQPPAPQYGAASPALPQAPQYGAFQPPSPAFGMPAQQPPAPPYQPAYQSFQPVGRWLVQIGDAVGSTMTLNLAPNGFFQAVQQQAQLGLNVQAAGQWAYVPQHQTLHLQGLINGFQPFHLGMTIQGMQNNGYYAVGADGYGYFFTRAG